ncbi:hypothetical protein EI94DRAFT_1760608 [Lactarius quietus]|nr:hypothetical protein EI94DRAFT_1760608 [Lactarius quietus]
MISFWSKNGNSALLLVMDSDVELNNLERPQDEGDDDDNDTEEDYDLNDDGATDALLTPGLRTRRESKQPATLAVATLWNQVSGIVVEVLPTLAFTIIGLLFTGELFTNITRWNAMTRINELIAIVLAILNLKGNIEMNLSARLGTAANMGHLDVPSVRNALILGNLALIQVQAAIVSFIAACFTFLLSVVFLGLGAEPLDSSPAEPRNLFHYSRTPSLGHPHKVPHPVLPPVGVSQSGFNEFVVVAATAMSAACLSAVVLGSFVSGLVVLCRKLGRNPDNIVPPITSCLSDLVTLSLLGVMSAVLTLGIGTVVPYLVITVVTVCAIASFVFVRRNEHVKSLLSTGWSPLLGAVVVTSGSGRVLDAFVSRYQGYAILAVAFGGLPGGAGSIFLPPPSPRPDVVSRGSDHSHHSPSPRLVILVLFFVSIPVAITFFFILRISAWLTTPFMFSILALFFLFTAIAISLILGYVLTTYLWSHKYDPDMYALPIHSRSWIWWLASVIGLHVRSQSSKA